MSQLAPHVTAHPSEDDLILYQLQESPDERSIRQHLDLCPTCAELADSIAHTLRIFSAETVPAPDVEAAWQRLRPQLPMVGAVPVSRPRAFLFRTPALASAAGLALAALLLLAVLLPRHGAEPRPAIASLGPGPLTTHPVDPAVAAHLDSAERFLTEVSHTSEPLDSVTREQAHALLLENAVYVRTARSAGDLADADVLERLGRVLTAVDHEPESSEPGWHVRFEINANGLLLDLRILRQNNAQQHASQTSATQDTLQ